MKIRLSKDRGTSKTGWLDSKHSFSFGDYYDPQNTQFGALRVINEDRVKPSNGFGEHSHQNMEILTYVLSGELEHKDSMGNGSVIRPNSIQRMSAGTGVRHREWNHSSTESVHFLQIWVIPEKEGLKPGYEEKNNLDTTINQWQVLASNRSDSSGVYLNQDLILSHAIISGDAPLSFVVEENRMAWLQIVSGSCKIDGTLLNEGDGLTIQDRGMLQISALNKDAGARVLWFDLQNTTLQEKID